ncbi:SMI1/KNR4 family protein [Paenibacillus harenae]|uniref:Knr4/Smi1-like domain-containing protein n=1 Tax=Paenibacillus harenae TaxID=306543 RepID=A0ABT9TTH7_PAEHA|nr:SMI1/KNR4 family protein [Paenibacillus harenae]MDQ0110643.1 hypothetical protein [Paenibacillus harenae]
MIDLSKFPNLIPNKPVSLNEMKEVEESMNIILPNVYKELLKETNGFSVGGGLLIYGTEDIIERNETWEVKEYAEGYVSIGDDGGGNVFLMLQGEQEIEVISVDSGDMNPKNARKLASNLIDWINGGCTPKEQTAVDFESPDSCKILLIKAPDGGLKDLIKIKKVLGIEIPTSELLEGAKHPPSILSYKFPYGKAKKLVEKLGEIGDCLSLEGID